MDLIDWVVSLGTASKMTFPQSQELGYTQSNPTGIYISLDDFGQYYEENGKEFEPTESYFLDDYEDNLPAKWTSATELRPWQPYQKQDFL